MIRFRTEIRAEDVMGEDSNIVLNFHSTVVWSYFPEGEISGDKLKEAISESMKEYKERLEERGYDPNSVEEKLDEIRDVVGENCENIADDKKYRILSSETMLRACELY